jgi:dethiobiotin synthetase
MLAQSLTAEYLAKTKRSFTTRRVPTTDMASLLSDPHPPRVGDLILARVATLGQHKRLQLHSGRPAALYEGDEIIVAFGNRYAPDQFEAELPETMEGCHLVAAGGVASWVLSQHERMDQPTEIHPLGVIADGNAQPLNLRDYALPLADHPVDIPVLAIVGTCMNSGKTTTAAHVVHGLVKRGYRVGAAKITGTGAYGDFFSLTDAGAEWVLDFTDAGFPSTYLIEQADLDKTMQTLLGHLKRHGATAIVIEVADGLYQRETGLLLKSRLFRDTVHTVLMAAQDSLGAAAGATWLRRNRLPVRGLAGAMTQSQLACREAKTATRLPVYTMDQLGAGEPDLIGCCPKLSLRAVS